MTPLPAALGGSGGLVAWRLDAARFATNWDSGIGASLGKGGRWNSPGIRVVYCSLDPATTILESAVHKGFDTLDIVPQVLTSMDLLAPGDAHIVHPQDIPEAEWLESGIPTRDQQQFGDSVLAAHRFVVLPSVVSRRIWNMVFRPDMARSGYRLRSQEPFELDRRLHHRQARSSV